MKPSEAPVISVVIPTYNRRDLVRQAVESTLAQTCKEIEIIIVDDGSTDGTAETIRGLQSAEWADKPVRLVEQANGGAASARNHGLSVSRGEYIQFLDSDDELHSRKLELQLEVLRRPENEAAVCCTCYGRMGSEFAQNTPETEHRIGKLHTDARALLRIMASREVHVMCTIAPLWRRAFLGKRQGWLSDLRLGDDLEYYTRLLSQAEQTCFVDAELFLVRVHAGERLSTRSLTERAVRDTIRTRRAVHATLVAGGVWDREMQKEFLSVVRVVYANVLVLGDRQLIVDLEDWMLELARQPASMPSYRALILLRRVIGAKALLNAYALSRRLRSA